MHMLTLGGQSAVAWLLLLALKLGDIVTLKLRKSTSEALFDINNIQVLCQKPALLITY